MSYCVNCGVKLAPGQGKCPLCQTVVHNPQEPYDPQVKRNYPKRTVEQDLSINKKYATVLLLLVLGVPPLICLAVDWLMNSRFTWALYPAGGLAMVFAWIALPLWAEKGRIYWAIAGGTAALILYLWLVEAISPNPGWFRPVVFPVLLLAMLMALAMVASARQRLLRGLNMVAMGLVLVGFLTLAIELLTASLATNRLTLQWSPYVLIPCTLVALVLWILQAHQPLREEMRKRLHI